MTDTPKYTVNDDRRLCEALGIDEEHISNSTGRGYTPTILTNSTAESEAKVRDALLAKGYVIVVEWNRGWTECTVAPVSDNENTLIISDVINGPRTGVIALAANELMKKGGLE